MLFITIEHDKPTEIKCVVNACVEACITCKNSLIKHSIVSHSSL